jgi:hypothetical protein
MTMAGTKMGGQDHSQENLEINKDNDFQKGRDESTEVSYSILVIDEQGLNVDDTLQKIATLNVQLATEGSESLPFVQFSNFDSTKYSDRLFLYGPSGCGKSRTIFELIRENLANFINLRNTIGSESGR